MSDTKKLTITCPGCSEEIVVDARTGEILFHKAHKAAPAGGKDFESLLAGLDASKSRADDVFSREMSALKDRDRLLEEKFREAMERAKEDDHDTPPKRPWDFD